MLLLRVLWAEVLKTKRTAALWMVVVAPASVVLLMVFLLSQVPTMLLYRASDLWMGLTRIILVFWAILMMPLYVTLATALLAGLEHAENQWKLLLARPVPRWTVYVAKLIVSVTMLCASATLLVGGVLVAGTVLPVLQPELRFRSPIPLFMIFEKASQVTALAFLSLTIQHWMSLRWRPFAVAVGVGVVATVVGYVMVVSTRHGSALGIYFPWALPMTALAMPPLNIKPLLWLSGAVGLGVAAAGCLDFCRREVK